MSAWVLSRAFVVEAFRGRLFLIAMGLAVLFVGASFVMGPLSLGTGDKITRDMGLAAVLLTGTITLFTGCVHLVTREIDRKAIYILITRPVRRADYVLGKFGGMVLVGWGALMTALIVLVVALGLRGGTLDMAMGQAVLLSALELVVLAAVATFFASVAGPVAAMLYGFGAFLAGHTMSDILAASAGSTTGISSVLLKALGWVIPDLSRFDMRLHAVHGVTIPAGEIGWAALYALLYSAALLCLASAVFARREFR